MKKILILAILLITGCVPITPTPDPGLRKLLRPIDIEVREYLADPQNSRSPEALDELARELASKYEENLDQLRRGLPGPTVPTEQVGTLNYTIIREHIHKVLQEIQQKDKRIIATIVFPKVATPTP